MEESDFIDCVGTYLIGDIKRDKTPTAATGDIAHLETVSGHIVITQILTIKDTKMTVQACTESLHQSLPSKKPMHLSMAKITYLEKQASL